MAVSILVLVRKEEYVGLFVYYHRMQYYDNTFLTVHKNVVLENANVDNFDLSD